jgi:large subunit ribosomal protein L25
MPRRHTLAVNARAIKGKEVDKIRREGLTPGVIYGPVVDEPIIVSVDTRTLNRMYIDLGPSTLIDVALNGTTHVVYMRQVDIDRLARRPRHVEFFAPNLRLPITATVAVMFVGEPGILNGVINHGHDTLQVRGLPEQLPSAIEVDLSVLTEYEQALYVRDVVVPAEVEILTDGDELLVKLSAPDVQAAADVEAEALADAGPDVGAEAAEDEGRAAES